MILIIDFDIYNKFILFTSCLWFNMKQNVTTAWRGCKYANANIVTYWAGHSTGSLHRLWILIISNRWYHSTSPIYVILYFPIPMRILFKHNKYTLNYLLFRLSATVQACETRCNFHGNCHYYMAYIQKRVTAFRKTNLNHKGLCKFSHLKLRLTMPKFYYISKFTRYHVKLVYYFRPTSYAAKPIEHI